MQINIYRFDTDILKFYTQASVRWSSKRLRICPAVCKWQRCHRPNMNKAVYDNGYFEEMFFVDAPEYFR